MVFLVALTHTCGASFIYLFGLVEIQLHEIPLVADKVGNPGDTVLYLYVKPRLLE